MMRVFICLLTLVATLWLAGCSSTEGYRYLGDPAPTPQPVLIKHS